ncbi:MAG: cation acetate symporter, partial [Planctomycetes bacterium]|nr:cation acetate symporter [Planctomycetota bacterium]
LPHVIQKFYVVPKTSDARWSVVWGLFFISVLYWFAPVYSALGKVMSSHPDIGALSKDAIVVYTAQLGEVHPWIVGFLAAGAVSAAFSTVSGLLVAGASAFSHDLYHKVFRPEASGEMQMKMAQLGTILMAVGVMIVALFKLALIAQLVATAFSLAGCTLFPLFLLGIWWSGSNRAGATAGLATGLGVSLLAIAYFVAGKFQIDLPGKDMITYWVNPWYFAWFGAPLSIIVHIIVAKMTEPTPEDVKKFLAVNVHGVKAD